jgi:dTDP-4-dehydrorhamnose reductase
LKILLLGADGQLATALAPLFETAGHVVATLPRATCDLTLPRQLEEQMAAHCPDTVVNTAAFNQVDQCEMEIDQAFCVNGYGPRMLARFCEERGARLVHFSTNYVFDGRQQIPYDEEAPPNPLSSYGLSKLAGESFVRRLSRRHLIIRTCGVFGFRRDRRPGANFIERITTAATAGRPLRVVDDQIMTPTYAGHLATAVAGLLGRGASGLYHVTNSGWCSWAEFAREILIRTGAAGEVHPVSSREFAAPAKRPAYSVLQNARLRSAGIHELPEWSVGLDAYLRERRTTVAAS